MKKSLQNVFRVLCVTLVLVMVMPNMIQTASAATQTKTIQGMEYVEETSYTATTGGGIYLRDENDNTLCYIPKGETVEVLGKYLETCKVGNVIDKGNRSVMRYGKYTGHARDGLLTNKKAIANSKPPQDNSEANAETLYGMSYIPGKYTAKTRFLISLRDKDDKLLVTIPAGVEVEVYGVYTEKCSLESTTGNRSVMKYGDYVGHARHGGLSKIKENTTENDTPDVSTKTKEGMTYRNENTWYAITSNSITLRDENDQKILYIPKGAIVQVEGKYLEECKVGDILDKGNRSVMQFGGNWGHARDTALTKIEVPAFKENSLSYRYAVTNTSKTGVLNLRAGASTETPLLKALHQYTIVYVLGTSTENPDRLVVVYGNSTVGTILNNVQPIKDALAVSIDRQKTMVFSNGRLIGEFDNVTGDPTKGWDTNLGKTEVVMMARNYYLSRFNLKVSYWVMFNWSEEAFHDNINRVSYGDKIYIGDGSHGCVNQKLEDAKFIYEHSYLGMPVYVSQN